MHLGFILASPSLFSGENLTCAMLVHGDVPENQLKWTVFVRSTLNDSLFILCAISLVSYICKITKMSFFSKCLPRIKGKCFLNLYLIKSNFKSSSYETKFLYFFKRYSECQLHLSMKEWSQEIKKVFKTWCSLNKWFFKQRHLS